LASEFPESTTLNPNPQIVNLNPQIVNLNPQIVNLNPQSAIDKSAIPSPQSAIVVVAALVDAIPAAQIQ